MGLSSLRSLDKNLFFGRHNLEHEVRHNSNQFVYIFADGLSSIQKINKRVLEGVRMVSFGGAKSIFGICGPQFNG